MITYFKIFSKLWFYLHTIWNEQSQIQENQKCRKKSFPAKLLEIKVNYNITTATCTLPASNSLRKTKLSSSKQQTFQWDIYEFLIFQNKFNFLFLQHYLIHLFPLYFCSKEEGSFSLKMFTVLQWNNHLKGRLIQLHRIGSSGNCSKCWVFI